MKKSNVLVFALLAVVSAFLLWLWYFLGLNHVDEPLDLVLSIVWWVVIAVAVLLVVRMERVRRERIRTVYVGDYATFNSEQGLVSFETTEPMETIVASILENLTYGFSRADFPDREKFDARYFVRTKEFSVWDGDEGRAATPSHKTAPVSRGSSGQKAWKGEVIVVATKKSHPFETPKELSDILAILERPVL